MILPVRTQDNFIRTFTGRKFWPLNPRAEDISIEDIAHALSLICRFSGHTHGFYSVADHSLRVSKLAEHIVFRELGIARGREMLATVREIALWGLLHDASEAYLCDMPSPLKKFTALGDLYRQSERLLMQVIAERFDLMPHEPALVKTADRILLQTEMRDLMNACLLDGPSADLEHIFPLDPAAAEAEFLRRFKVLILARNTYRTCAALEANANQSLAKERN